MPTATDVRRSKILEGVDAIPPFPEVASRVLSLAQDPDSSAADLARAVSRDASLTSSVLRAANSAAMGSRDPVTGLPEAVVRLGIRSVRDLVVVDCLPASRRQAPGMVQRQLWMHSVATALCCRAIGVFLHGPDPEWDFLAGLFHDVGRMHLNDLFPQVYQKFWESELSDSGWIQAERAAFGIDHAELGGAILARWDLSKDLQQAVSQHHLSPAELSGTSLRVAAADEMTKTPLPDSAEEIQLTAPESVESACGELGLVGESFDDFAARVTPLVVREIQIFASIP
ncbi:MAG: HDOD domain-containing protein [Candidatus Eisenbacteria bacterium]|uniref:HDOD domain-containing protein n=1 Tax=Eiseniibacteriota bacterium TaxID=2212470 RepID=A0A956LYQ6_UNCEI|nr:HDOD domain-containing protein [Candidatus Eisenbacteria bacterium]